MLNDPSLTLADRLGWIIELFCKTMAPEACAPRFGWLSPALWNRVRRLERRFAALYAMWTSGRLPKARSARAAHPIPRPRPSGGEVDPSVAVSTCPARLLPRAFAWLRKVLPKSAGTLGWGMESLVFNYPETKAFVVAVPQAGRVLRPLCRMAGVKAPEWLALPKRQRGSSPRPSPQGGEGEGRRRRTAREVARAAIERSERTGKPVDPRKIGAVAYGYVLHWPRDGNCPPPEIGYGGRSFPPLPKDYKRPEGE